MRSGDKEKLKEQALLQTCLESLEQEKPLSVLELTEEEEIILKSFQLLTSKPVIYAANVADDELSTLDLEAVKQQLELKQTDTLVLVSAKIESDYLA